MISRGKNHLHPSVGELREPMRIWLSTRVHLLTLGTGPSHKPPLLREVDIRIGYHNCRHDESYNKSAAIFFNLSHGFQCAGSCRRKQNNGQRMNMQDQKCAFRLQDNTMWNIPSPTRSEFCQKLTLPSCYLQKLPVPLPFFFFFFFSSYAPFVPLSLSAHLCVNQRFQLVFYAHLTWES